MEGNTEQRKEAPAYYAVIPALVRYDVRLPYGARLLYGELTALCGSQGYCWARNSYFSELYQIEKETVSRWISALEEAGHIRVEVLNGSTGFDRKVWVAEGVQTSTTHDGKRKAPMTENARPPCAKTQGIKNTTRGILQEEKNTSDAFKPEPSKTQVLATELATLLLLEHLKLDPKFLGRSDKVEEGSAVVRWSRDIEKLLRIDGREAAEVANVIQWAKKDSFWGPNIASGSKLRQQYSRLLLLSKNRPLGLRSGSPEPVRQASTAAEPGQQQSFLKDLEDKGVL